MGLEAEKQKQATNRKQIIKLVDDPNLILSIISVNTSEETPLWKGRGCQNGLKKLRYSYRLWICSYSKLCSFWKKKLSTKIEVVWK